MRVSIYYINGAIDEFNFETFTTAEPFQSPAGGSNVSTEFCLRTDLLAQEGLRLDIYWYNTVDDENTRKVFIPEAGRKIAVAGRELGRVLYLVSKSELSHISKVLVDGEVVVWRQGQDLINAVAFASQEMLCYSDASTTSINAKVTEIFDYLKSANPDMPDEQITRLFGYPYAAYLRILEDEGAQNARRRDGLPTRPEIAQQVDTAPYVQKSLQGGAQVAQREDVARRVSTLPVFSTSDGESELEGARSKEASEDETNGLDVLAGLLGSTEGDEQDEDN